MFLFATTILLCGKYNFLYIFSQPHQNFKLKEQIPVFFFAKHLHLLQDPVLYGPLLVAGTLSGMDCETILSPFDLPWLGLDKINLNYIVCCNTNHSKQQMCWFIRTSTKTRGFKVKNTLQPKPSAEKGRVMCKNRTSYPNFRKKSLSRGGSSPKNLVSFLTRSGLLLDCSAPSLLRVRGMDCDREVAMLLWARRAASSPLITSISCNYKVGFILNLPKLCIIYIK